jgi:hypothetical protein
MKTKNSMDEMEARATEALRALLGEVSVIKLKGIRREAKGAVLAHVDVLGHSHTLACEVKSNAGPENLRNVLRELHEETAHMRDAVPVLIAPYLSPEAQAMCKENHAGFLDLEGNARLALGEVFIGKRALTHHNAAGAATLPPSRTVRSTGHVRMRPPAA